MRQLPTTPGSLIMYGEPKLYPEDGSRYMASVWQLQDGGKWQELTDDGKRGARMDAAFFARNGKAPYRNISVLYVAPADPKPYKELRELSARLDRAVKEHERRQRDIDDMRTQVDRLQRACAEEAP